MSTTARWVLLAVIASVNAGLVAALNFKVLAPPESVRFALISVLIVMLAPLAGLLKSPMGKEEPSPKSDPERGSVDAMLLVVLTASSVFFLLTMAFSGCASNADGLRQACTDVDQILTVAYQSTSDGFKADQTALRAELSANRITAEKATSRLADHKGIVDKVLASLDVLRESQSVLCNAIPAVEAGVRKDGPQLISAIMQIAAAVPPLLQAILTLTSSLSTPRLNGCAHV